MKSLKTLIVAVSSIGLLFAQLPAAKVPQQPAQRRAPKVAPQPWYFGAIDIGSRGIKSTLFKFVKEGEWKDTQVLKAGTQNACLVGKMTPDKRFTPDCIEDAVKNAVTLLEEMKAVAAKEKITNVKYFLVGSSGVAQGVNKAELVAAMSTATGLDMEFVDANTEARYGLISAVPPAYRSTAVMIDQGSGNTKVACQDKSPNDIKTAEIVLGTVTTANEALGLTTLLKSSKDMATLVKKLQGVAESPKRAEALGAVAAASTELGALTVDYSDPKKNVRSRDLVQKAEEISALISGMEGAQDLAVRAKGLLSQAKVVMEAETKYEVYVSQVAKVVREDVQPVYLREARNKPCLAPQPTIQNGREIPGRIYLLGGAPWAAATFSHPETVMQNYVLLTRADLEKVLVPLRAGESPKVLPATTQGQRARANALEDPKRKAAELSRLAAIDKKAASERSNVGKVFGRDFQLSGITLLDGIIESVHKAGSPNTNVYFVRNASYIYGFALDKFKEARDSE